jgi:hypothetical protein
MKTDHSPVKVRPGCFFICSPVMLALVITSSVGLAQGVVTSSERPKLDVPRFDPQYVPPSKPYYRPPYGRYDVPRYEGSGKVSPLRRREEDIQNGTSRYERDRDWQYDPRLRN